jgi:hypothetical protein
VRNHIDAQRLFQGGFEMDNKSSSDAERSELERLINNRMYELLKAQMFLGEGAEKFDRYSKFVKVSVITLGALVATKETLSVIIGISKALPLF